jgi:1-acyl-sn-glycerol-3-phosphate acyltransferase
MSNHKLAAAAAALMFSGAVFLSPGVAFAADQDAASPKKARAQATPNPFQYPTGSGWLFGIGTEGGAGTANVSATNVNTASLTTTSIDVHGLFGYVWAVARSRSRSLRGLMSSQRWSSLRRSRRFVSIASRRQSCGNCPTASHPATKKGRINAPILAKFARRPKSDRLLDRLAHGNAMLVFSYSSYADALLLAAVLLPGESAYAAQHEFAEQSFAGPFLRRLGALFVERYDLSGSLADTERAIAAARQGRNIVFFPEETFTRRAGVSEFYLGAFKVAVEAGLPVVPGILRGTRSMLRSDQWFRRWAALSVTI